MDKKFDQELFQLNEPIQVFCVAAESFPEGVQKAHQALHEIAPFDESRRYFGLSWGGPAITYKAAATEIQDGELSDKQLEAFTIRSGPYLSIVLNDLDKISAAFQTLIADPRVDPRGYCVEMYLGEQTVRCMVTIDEE